MNPVIDDSTRVFQRATQWLSDLQDGQADAAALFRWLAESPRHVEEFALVLSFTDEVAGLTEEQCATIAALNAAQRATPAVVPFASAEVGRGEVVLGARASAPADSGVALLARRRGTAAGLYAVAATLLLALIGGLLWWNNGWKTYATDFGEQRVIDLADGSMVTLNTESRIKVRFDGESRDIRMISGEALFKVHHDPRHPFRVHAEGSVIQALGTQFNVYRRETSTTVSVLEGRVRITRGAGTGKSSERAGEATPPVAQSLDVGQQAEIRSTGQVVRRPIDVRQAAAWRQRKLVFNDESLSEIAAEFNRYNRRPQIRIDDTRAGDRRFAATFDADAPEALIKVLEKDPDLTIERIGDEVVVRSR